MIPFRRPPTFKGRKASVLALLALGACASPTTAQDSRAADAGQRTKLPSVLTPALKPEMTRHAEHGALLMRAFVLGEHQNARQELEALIAEPKLARPLAGQPTLNEVLPERLFSLDERYRARLEQLQRSLRKGDDEAILNGMSGMLRACRQCHRELKPVAAPLDGGR